ncbi:hypothetical protein [Candidatus Soleaferrea massiliensis]|uniref:hypothetical protein n=1 Tax=Candidatus Soleaferrea massiliensis TaxID=1470354 RepID=UPI0012E00E8C|nr:hypothetical protein [Candidatus Soleaferrea massiliensis]
MATSLAGKEVAATLPRYLGKTKENRRVPAQKHPAQKPAMAGSHSQKIKMKIRRHRRPKPLFFGSYLKPK